MGRPQNPHVAEGLALMAKGSTPEDAAEQLTKAGKVISSRTLRRAAQAPAKGRPATPTTASASGQAIASPAGGQAPAKGHPVAPPQGGPVAPPPDRLLQDVREILGARHPAALEELEAGLVLRARGDEHTYRAWLERPFPAATELTTDPRANAQRLLAKLEDDYDRAPIMRRGALAEKITGALRELRQYFPPAPAPRPRDEVVEALDALDVDWRAIIEKPLAEIERRKSAAA